VRQSAINVIVLSLVIILAALAPVLTSCGGSQRDKTIKASFVTLKAAHAGFVQWDTTRQAAIIASSNDAEVVRAKLKAYREKQTEVYAALAEAFKLLLDAATGDADPAKAVREGTRVIEVIEQFKEQP